MPAPHSYKVIMKDVEKLEDEWQRVQTERIRYKKEGVRKTIKERIDGLESEPEVEEV